MEQPNKPGKLSNEELEYIRQHLDDSLEDIAKHLHRNTKTIEKHVKNAHVKSIVQEVDEDYTIIARLVGRKDWPSIQRQFNKEELEIFKEEWVKFYRQFGGDVLATEEMQMISVIRLELLVHRNLEDRNKVIKQIAELEEEREDIVAELKKEDDPEEKSKLADKLRDHDMLIGDCRASLMSRTGEFEKFSSKAQASYKDLKSTRDQRFAELKDTKVNFVDWLKQLHDKDKMEYEAKELGLRIRACDNETKRLSQTHKYMDGRLDQPLLTPETVE